MHVSNETLQMKKYLYIVILTCCFSFFGFGQKVDKPTPRMIFGGTIALEWSAYQRYQRPSTHEFAQLSGQKNSAGQILNLLPNLRMGIFLLGYDSYNLHFFFVLEGGITYSPFSQDIDRYKGQGALAFPIILSHHFIINDNFLLGIGAGVQFSRMEYGNNPLVFQDATNPFFMTYVGEVILGAVDAYGALFGLTGFARIGFNQYEAHTLDIGIRAHIGYPIAET